MLPVELADRLRELVRLIDLAGESVSDAAYSIFDIEDQLDFDDAAADADELDLKGLKRDARAAAKDIRQAKGEHERVSDSLWALILDLDQQALRQAA